MKLSSSIVVALSLALPGVSGKILDTRPDMTMRDLRVMLDSRASGKMPSYNDVLQAALKKYPGMQEGSSGNGFNYNLKPYYTKDTL